MKAIQGYVYTTTRHAQKYSKSPALISDPTFSITLGMYADM